jgi:class 3 adenylate cyclase
VGAAVLDDINSSRRLAAILAADIAGYSRLMGANEKRYATSRLIKPS